MDDLSFAASIVGMVLFWSAVAWLVMSRTGRKIFRVSFLLFAGGVCIGSLWYFWQPYTSISCLAAGFAAGLLFAEWYHDIKNIKSEPAPLTR